jgi:hypothetical protein
VKQFPEQVKAPATHDELMSLMARRDELQAQLRSLGNSRAELAQQINDLGSNAELRAEPMARLRIIDADIKRVDASLRAANRTIESAEASGLGVHEDTPAPTVIHGPDVPQPPSGFAFSFGQPPWQQRIGQTLATTVPITAATVVLLGAVLYWRISRSMRNQLNKILAAQSGRLDELQRSVDTVAVEVERVSENQRFVTKLVGEKESLPRA